MATCSLQANPPHLTSEPPHLTSESTYDAASDPASECTFSSDPISDCIPSSDSASDCTFSSYTASDPTSGCTSASASVLDYNADPVPDESSGSADACLATVLSIVRNFWTRQLQASNDSAPQSTESLL